MQFDSDLSKWQVNTRVSYWKELICAIGGIIDRNNSIVHFAAAQSAQQQRGHVVDHGRRAEIGQGQRVRGA